MSKVILIDSSGLFVPTVKVWGRLRQGQVQTGTPSFVMPAHCMYFNSLLSSLSKIGVDRDDTVIIAEEGKSWRKDYAAFYKAQREGLREKDTFVDWPYQYQQLNKLHGQLKNSTNWFFVREPNLESDDIIAIAARFFKDQEVIIATGDKDLFQLAFYGNVKLFTLNKKINGSKGMYENVPDPIKIINDKAKKGDVGDNILTSPDDTEEDYNLRLLLVDLLNLPKEIELKGVNAIKEALSLARKTNLAELPPFKNVQDKFLKIYDKEKVVTYDQCIKLLEKRIIKKKKEKLTK